MSNEALSDLRTGLRSPLPCGWPPSSGDNWSYHSFRGAKWTDVKKPERRQYLENAYRVLLTRARQGMVIFVPPGTKRDKMRSPGFYGGLCDYLTGSGTASV